jgi:hypothetical protein
MPRTLPNGHEPPERHRGRHRAHHQLKLHYHEQLKGAWIHLQEGNYTLARAALRNAMLMLAELKRLAKG